MVADKMTAQDWQVAQDVVIVLAVLTLAGGIIDYLRRKVR